MQKIINEKGNLVLKREPWMQALWETTYPLTVMEAVRNGFDGSFERAMAGQLKWMYKNLIHLPEIDLILQETGTDNHMSDASFYRAAELIIESKN